MTTVPYQKTSQTSRLGADAVLPHAPSQRERIVAYLAAHGPHTRSELAEALGMRLSAVCGRTKPLLDDGKLRVYEVRTCRVTGQHVEAVGVRREEKQGALW